jgi:tetratricopeptide (TPR) repeat protein
MKDTILLSLLIWISVINAGKVWPTSKGERYYRNLQKWYLMANNGEWDKAKKIENKLKSGDIDNFKKGNEKEELEKRFQILDSRDHKNADDWMEIAVLFYRLGKKDEAFKAITKAHNLDPIREDISKIYFTYQTSQQLPRLP